jgi:hypothetical protein
MSDDTRYQVQITEPRGADGPVAVQAIDTETGACLAYGEVPRLDGEIDDAAVERMTAIHTGVLAERFPHWRDPVAYRPGWVDPDEGGDDAPA